MPPRLPAGTRFVVPRAGHKKYTAVVPVAGGTRRVSFGDRRYQHYADAVPRALGGGRWTSLDHRDAARRRAYRRRHAGMVDAGGVPYIRRRYTPAWFSYYFLW